MKQIRVATAWFKSGRIIPKNSNYFAFIDSLKPCCVVIYARVSHYGQRANLRYQIQWLKAALERRGFTVIAVYEEIVPGWESMDAEFDLRSAFMSAVHKAIATNSIIVAVSVDRFKRSLRDRWRKGRPTT
jgi:predicted site-specific integrase-resolvase